MSALESDEEELKEGKRLNFLTPSKLLTRLPLLLAQIKAGNNSNKLKNEIRQVLFRYSAKSNHQNLICPKMLTRICSMKLNLS